nr:insulin-like peptide 7 [Hyphantria cunea]
MKFSLVLVLVVLASTAVLGDHAQIYCGRRLSNVLATLCWDVEMVKRDSGNQMLKENVRTLSGFRSKRGPVDECCYKPCTVDELLTYC